MKLKLKDVRLAFPNIWEAQAINPGDTPAFNARFIIPPDHPQIKEIEAAMVAAAKAQPKWGGTTKAGAPKWEAILEKCKSDGEVCFSRDEYANKDGDAYDGFEGMFHLGARNPLQPTIRDADKSVLTKASGKPYAGCQVVAILDIWAQDNAYGRGIRASLMGVQFLRDGDAFAGGRPASDDDFDDVSDTGEDDEDL